MSMKKISRRHFLKGTGFGAISLSSFNIISMFLSSANINKAFAIESETGQNHYFVQLFARGGGCWDHFGFTPDPLGAQYQQGPIGRAHVHGHQKIIGWNGASPITDDTGLISLHRHGQYHVPHVWSSKIPTGSGASVKATNLLDHSLSFSGIKNDVVGHVANQVLHEISPVLGTKGLRELFEEAQRTPMPTAKLHRYSNHGDNALEVLLEPFIDTSKDSKLSDQAFMQDLETVINVFETEAKKRGKPINDIHGKFQGALALLKSNFVGLSTIYPQLIQKYELIINKIISQPTYAIDGVTDAQAKSLIIPNGSTDKRFNYGETNANGHKIEGRSVGEILDTTNLKSLARMCAMAEFLVKNNLSSHLNMNLSGISFNLGGVFGMGWDQHYIGSVLHLIWDSLQMQCISACIYEMMSALNNQSVLFQFSSDFNRRSTGFVGTQHYDQGQNINLFHKDIMGHHRVGSIRPHSSTTTLEAGRYANTDTFAGPVRMSDYLATAAQILNLPNPSPNGVSIASWENNKIRIHATEPNKRIA